MAKTTRRPKKTNTAHPKQHDILALIFRLVESGLRPVDIENVLPNEFEKRGWNASRVWRRETIARAVSQAIQEQQLRWRPPLEFEIASSLSNIYLRKHQRFRNLSVWVIAAESAAQFAEGAMEGLLHAIRDRQTDKMMSADLRGDDANDASPGNRSIRIGWAGGRTPALLMGNLIERFHRARALNSDDMQGLPESLVLQSLVGVIGNSDPEFNPNRYYSRIPGDDDSRRFTKFIDFPMPGLVKKLQSDDLQFARIVQQSPFLEDAFRERNKVDMIVCSGGHWGFDCHNVCDYVDRSFSDGSENRDLWRRYVKSLASQDCVGDVMWQPVSVQKALDDSNFRVTSLFRLKELEAQIRDRKRVVVLLGPCSGKECARSKKDLLRFIMDYPQQLATHLIVDSRTALEYLEEGGDN